MGRSWLGPAVGTGLLLAGIAVRAQLATPWWWLGFNVALAWIPFVLGRAAIRSPWAFLLLAPAWVLFLPNAPYLVTDLVHLAPRRGVPVWFDVALLGGAAALGLGIGAVSLRDVTDAVAGWTRRELAVGLWAALPPLSGLGMAIGRELRWNSWSVLTRPRGLVAVGLELVRDPLGNLEFWAMATAFGLVFAAAACFAPPRATAIPAA